MNPNRMIVDTRFIVPSGIHILPHLREADAVTALFMTAMVMMEALPYEIVLDAQSGELLCVLTQRHNGVPTEAEMMQAAQSLAQFAAKLPQQMPAMEQQGVFENAHDVAQTMH
jgi:hypothetical protein